MDANNFLRVRKGMLHRKKNKKQVLVYPKKSTMRYNIVVEL